ncbi:MAG: hypothetical protein LC799_14655 [Actinobacteria bacterium]|nr:hypothetical protein [Actinomycetota bacterium]
MSVVAHRCDSSSKRCVILDKDGQLVGQSYHRHKGESHAEALALTQAGEHARNGTAVVTLEPCNHYGRTPPCHQALIDAGVRRVLVALIDPTSRGEGGVALLHRAGIEVEVGILADEALLVLGPWLCAFESKRPRVHWLHVLDDTPEVDTLMAVPDAAPLKASHDVVLTTDGTVVEADVGVHHNNLTVPTSVDLAEPKAALDALYRGGVRSILLVGDHERVLQLLNAGLVDCVSAYLSDKQAPTNAQSRHDTFALPDGVRLVEVTKLPGWVRLSARVGPRSVRR